MFTLGVCPIQWSSNLQSEITLSTTEAEYIALSQAMRELLPSRQLLNEMVQNIQLVGGEKIAIKSTVFEDDNGVIAAANAVKMIPRTKHIAVKYHFFKIHIREESGIELVKIDTNLQKADIFTKGMSPEKLMAIQKLMAGS